MPAPRPKMRDVAALAGVSQMTVSRALSGKGPISAEVRARVLEAAATLGYARNRLAGALREERSPLVALVLPSLENRVFNDLLRGATETLDAGGLRPVFGVHDYREDREAALAADLLSWRPSGLILAGLEHAPELVEAARRAGAPVIETMDLDGDPIMAAVGFGQAAAGEAMAARMLAAGRRRFLCIGAGAADRRAGKRFHGFMAAVARAGGRVLAPPLHAGGAGMPDGRRATAIALTGPGREADAIFYANDELAAGGMMHCLAEGIDVPGRLALGGFNGLEYLEALPRRLTTIRTPRRAIGAEAARLILQGVPAAPTKIDLGFELVEGDTL